MQIAGPNDDTYPAPFHGWVCFHCGEHFPGNLAGQKAAEQHFGAAVDAIPGCRLRMRKGEHSLLRRIRWLEGELRGLRDRVLAEDTDKDRELYAMAANHAQALIREEEKGYERGMRDARKESEPCQEPEKPDRHEFWPNSYNPNNTTQLG